MRPVDLIAGLDAQLDSLFIVVHDHWHLQLAGDGVGNRIWIGGLFVKFLKQAHTGHIRQSDAAGVAVALFRQVQNHNPLRVNSAGSIGGGEPSGDIGVHAVAADVRATLIHDQNIAFVKEDPRHRALGPQQNSRLLRDDLIRGKADDLAGAVISVLHQS